MFKINWNNKLVPSAMMDDVDRVLDDLQLSLTSMDPQLVTVESIESGDSIAIGIGRDRSVLNYIDGSGDPPYFTSVGELTLDEPIAFCFNGEWSEFPMRCSIPTALARQAVREFCETGKRSKSIDWEED